MKGMDHPLERLVFFSDAVFAIAITLLVIEIEVPDFARAISVAEQWGELAALLPSFFAFVLSFFVIGRFWMGHHALFSRIMRYDRRLQWPNLLYLMSIALMPFAAAFLGRNVGHFVPELFYNATMLLCAALNLLVARVARQAGLLEPAEAEEFTDRPLSVALGALVCVGLTFVMPLLSQWGMISIPLWSRLLGRKPAT